MRILSLKAIPNLRTPTPPLDVQHATILEAERERKLVKCLELARHIEENSRRVIIKCVGREEIGRVIMLRSFSVSDFRNLCLGSLSFKRINLIVGPNNTGKSNLIDAINFYSGLVGSNEKGSAFLSEIEKRGWDDLLNRNADKPGFVRMNWVLNTGAGYQDILYDLEFRVGTASEIPEGFYITREDISFAQPASGKSEPFRFISCHGDTSGRGLFSVRTEDRGHGRLNLEVDRTDTVLRQTEHLLQSDDFRIQYYPNFVPIVKTVQDFFARFHSYSSTGFDLRAIRELADAGVEERSLKRDGSNFVRVLSYLEKTYDAYFDAYVDMVQGLLPELKRVRIHSLGEKKRELRLRMGSGTYKLSEMSDGTIKALLLALLLSTTEKTTILALDEPELNLHPAWQRVIARWVLGATKVEQVFINTHSPDFLDSFTEHFRNGQVGLFVGQPDAEESLSEVRPEDLDERLKSGWELGDLYRVGDPFLGGWPW